MIDTKALKDKILDLAMRGKLTPQDPNDEPASELLKRIKAEKEKLINQKKIKREKNGSEIFQGDDGLHYEKFADGTIKEIEVPYELPEGWAWANLNQVTNIVMGSSPSGNNIYNKPILNCVEFHQGKSHFSEVYVNESKKWTTEITQLIETDAVLMSVRAPVGDVNIINRPIVIGRGIAGLIPQINIKYLFYYLSLEKEGLEQNASGSTFRSITVKGIKKHLIAVPPLNEQTRIIKQINKSLVLVCAIKQNQNELNLISTNLKQKILDISMQGKLIPQNINDEPASILLDKIRAEKQKLFKEGKIKKKDLEEIQPTLDEDNAYYQSIPKSWSLVCLKTIVYILNGDRGKNYPSKEKLSFSGNIPFISAINLKNGLVSKESLKYLNDEQYNLLRSGKIKKDDILFCIRGSLAKNGISKFTKGAIASSLVILRSYNKRLISPLFLLAYCNSTQISSELNKYNNGTAQPNLAASDLSKFVIALPPKMQQHKILRAIYRVNNIVDFIK